MKHLVHSYHLRILIVYYRREAKYSITRYLDAKRGGHYAFGSPADWLRRAKEEGAEALWLARKLGIPLGLPAKPLPTKP